MEEEEEEKDTEDIEMEENNCSILEIKIILKVELKVLTTTLISSLLIASNVIGLETFNLNASQSCTVTKNRKISQIL